MGVHLMLDKPAGLLNCVGKKIDNGAHFEACTPEERP
jgi:hypothetical protein